MKNKIVYRAIAIVQVVTSSAVAQQQALRTLSLQDCLNIALERSTAVLKGNNNVAFAGAQVLAAYGQYLPNLSAGAGYN